jgi:hypothetical protein
MLQQLVGIIAITSALSAPSPPHFWEKAANARWLTHQLNYGVLSTSSSTLDAAAFGNVQSFADGPSDNSTGRLFFYVSDLDASMKDIAKNPKCSLTLSLQMLDDYCTKEWAPVSGQIDPEDPRCTRLTLVGQMRNVTTEELPFAKDSLFQRHPVMKQWPASHDFHVVTLDIEHIWLIDMFGGASIISPDDYFKAKPSTNKAMGFSEGFSVAAHTAAMFEPPAYAEKAKTARWMAHNLTYGVLSTMSQMYKGYPFGNPQSFVDGSADNGTGLLYFYVSDLDASMTDIKVDKRASFTLTEEFSNAYCSTKSPPEDPEDPPCARLVFSGTMRNTTSVEQATAKANLFARHPGMSKWPADHSWHVVTMDFDQIWLIDWYGGASIISKADYLAATL